MLDFFRLLDPNAYIVLILQAIAQQFLETGKIRFLEIQSRGEIEILAIANGPIAEAQARSTLKRKTVEPLRFIERANDVVMNELFLYNRKQCLHFAPTSYVFGELLEINRHLPIPPSR